MMPCGHLKPATVAGPCLATRGKPLVKWVYRDNKMCVPTHTPRLGEPAFATGAECNFFKAQIPSNIESQYANITCSSVGCSTNPYRVRTWATTM